jgi:hypothetical protein
MNIRSYSLLITSIFLYYCSSGGGANEVVAPPDPSDSWGNWSEWSPLFSSQKANFTQSRTRTIQVNGSKDSNQPFGEGSESRTINVSSSSINEEENERTAAFNLDLNGDGDFVDYVGRTVITHTASNGLGSFSEASPWIITFDQSSDFFSLQFGKWFTTIKDSNGDFLFDWGMDIYDAFEDVDVLQRNTNETCFTVSNLSKNLDNTPYTSSLVDITDPTKIVYSLYDIPAEYYLGNEYIGNYIDVVGAYVTDDTAGNTVIGFSETMYVAGTLTSLITVNGTMGRVNQFPYPNCNSSSSKIIKLKRPAKYLNIVKEKLDSLK